MSSRGGEMKVAVIGSRNLTDIDIGWYISEDTEEIVSGGAVGVDFNAAKYAKDRGLKLTEFLPQYKIYGRRAPIVRNKQIVNYADRIIAFWDGHSKGTLFVIDYARKIGKPVEVIICE